MAYFRNVAEQLRMESAVSAKPWASVWRAADPARGAAVALKLIPMAGGPEDAPAFVRAMGTLAGLRHPGLPSLADFGFTPDGKAFLVFDWLDGSPGDALAGASPMQILPALAQAIEAVLALGRAGLVHHNLSPDNLLLTPGPGGVQAVATGFGTPLLRPPEARVAGGGGAASFAAPEIGTPLEAAAGTASDLYSLALIACVLLGARVHGAEGPAPRVSLPLGISFELEDDRALVETLERALRRDPRERPSGEAMRDAFQRALYGRHAEAAGPRPEAPRETRLVLTPGPDDTLFAPSMAGRLRNADPAIPPRPPVRDPGDDTNPLFLAEAARPAPAAAPDEAAKTAAPASPRSRRASDIADDLPPLPELPALDADLFPLAVPANDEGEAREVLSSIDLPETAPSALAEPPLAEPAAPPHTPQATGAGDEPAPPAPPPPRTPAARRAGRALAAAGVALAVAAGGAYLWFSHRAEPPAPESVSRSTARRMRTPPAPASAALPAISATAQASIAALPPALADAAAAFAEGRDDDARRALAGWEANGAAGAPAAACASYLALGASLAAAGHERLAAAEARQSLAAAAARERSAAAEARERAAAAIESEAETLAQTGAVEAALARLAPLQRAWPDRPGLAERMERYGALERSDRALRGLLAQAAAAEARRRPDEGLALLRDARPDARWEARVREARGRLERQLASLDQAPPSIQLAAPAAEYDKGAPAHLAFRVTDDYAVKTVLVRARAEGTAAYADLQPARTGADYAVDVPPSLHQNRTIEYYVVATDLSGHRAELGNAQAPQKLRRKRWYEKLLGGKKAGAD